MSLRAVPRPATCRHRAPGDDRRTPCDEEDDAGNEGEHGVKELELGGGDFSKSPPVQPTRLHRRRVLAQAGLFSALQFLVFGRLSALLQVLFVF